MEKAENEDIAVAHVADRLGEKFPDLPAEVVEETVAEVHDSFDDAHVRDFVPVIVEHEAAAKLRDLESSESAPASSD